MVYKTLKNNLYRSLKSEKYHEGVFFIKLLLEYGDIDYETVFVDESQKISLEGLWFENLYQKLYHEKIFIRIFQTI